MKFGVIDNIRSNATKRNVDVAATSVPGRTLDRRLSFDVVHETAPPIGFNFAAYAKWMLTPPVVRSISDQD